VQIKPQSDMKKFIYFLFVLAVVAPQLTQAQDEKPPKRPDNVGASDFDTFKESSFDILDESAKLKTDATKIDTDVKAYAATISNASLEKLKADFSAIKGVSKSSKELSAKIGVLDEQGKSLLASAKDFSPKMKAPAVTNNTKKSISGLDFSKKNLDVVSGLVATNSKLLADELKKRGQTVEED
jgi:hypothetical protein